MLIKTLPASSPDLDEPVLSWSSKSQHAPIETGSLCIEKTYGHFEANFTLEPIDLSIGNHLIHGDCLSVIKSASTTLAQTVSCIYIDPPYNSGSSLTHYTDRVSHGTWLNFMQQRLTALRALLVPGGIIFVSIDEDECAYLKVLMDEIFGRENYCGQLVWEKKRKPSFLNQNIGSVVEYILCYSSERKRSPAFHGGTVDAGESYPFYNAGNRRCELHFPSNSVTFVDFNDGVVAAQKMDRATTRVELKNSVSIRNGTNENEFVLEGEWRYSQAKLNDFVSSGDTIIVRGMPFRPRWVNNDLAKRKKMHNLLSRAHGHSFTYEDATRESLRLFGEQAFDYPKPEGLLEVLIGAVTKPGDLVLDAFAGSGTTGAVAHKMQRRWIMIESGEHCESHAFQRMQNIVDGKDPLKTSCNLKWSGGGAFSFWRWKSLTTS